MRLFTVALSLLALTACASSPVEPGTPFSREVTVAQGATMNVASGLTVKFVAVTGDSRCPGDAICITGGDAIVKLQVASGGSSNDIELHTGSQQPVISGGVTYELIQLMPYPFSSLPPIAPGDYRLTLRVTR